MIALAIRSRTSGLIALTCVIGLIWLLGISLYFLEGAAGLDLRFLRTLIDLPLALWCVHMGLRRHEKHDGGRLPFFGVALIVTVQTVLSLWLISGGAPYASISAWMNGLFITMLAMLITIGIGNMEYQRGGRFKRWMDRLHERNEADFSAPAATTASLVSVADSPFWRRVHNLFADLHNDERPETERIEKKAAQPKADARGAPAMARNPPIRNRKD